MSLLSPSEFEAVVSGRRRGLRASCLRGLLGLAEVPYTLAMRWRNRRYDRGGASIHRAGVPVVSVGNLTLGGTGKTPMIEWLARWFQEHGIRVGLASRGYGARAGSQNDEALELAQKLPGVPHVQNPDRVAACRELREQHGCGLILLDDGFQHRRLHRDLDIVLLDAWQPFGYGRIFPRGMLREPPAGLRRAHCVVLSRADAVEPARRERIRREVQALAPQAAWAEAIHAPLQLMNASGQTAPLESLRSPPVAAFCGIGNPHGFRHTLAACGYDIVAFREFPDHHQYSPADLDDVASWQQTHNAAAIVCTAKDLVKIKADRLGSHPLWAVRIGLQLTNGAEQLERLLYRLIKIQEK